MQTLEEILGRYVRFEGGPVDHKALFFEGRLPDVWRVPLALDPPPLLPENAIPRDDAIVRTGIYKLVRRTHSGTGADCSYYRYQGIAGS